ncbi:hypothetical protein [uncultured Roseivirga sp.]|uniref:hypothetical protein n=1 Tax=uncultured Roseivirga sp. TaxID=543088 RepID=UPI000D7A0799|nr:hypothetical protein [uncultured Roseivirga sp.]PWL32101.1 MAG: hypothetical protein DCO95_02655 [Roseivirga sp. XM-24bin3]
MEENIIPELIRNEIKIHLRKKCQDGEDGWSNANQDEDTLTGDFLGQLRSKTKRTNGWTWRINYHKFSGRGKGAYEKTTGADGIISIEIEKNSIKRTKSIIFQAKKKGNSKIQEQLDKMNKTLPGGNMVLVYGEDGYFGETGEIFKSDKEVNSRIGDYLSDIFLECKNGLWGVDYDGVRNELRIEDQRITKANIKHRLTIKAWS